MKGFELYMKSNKEKLMEQISLNSKEARKIIYQYLIKTEDVMVVKPKTEEILQGNLSELTEQDVVELLKLLGQNIQNIAFAEDIQIKEEEEYSRDEQSVLREECNTQMVQNKELTKENLNLKETINYLKETNDQLIKRLDKFERIIENFKKYNITDKYPLIEVDDETINELFIQHSLEGTIQLNNAYIFKSEGILIIPKTFYKIERDEN